ncbi:MAG: insulinase family protein [Treponema sp.]|jgi:Zn-dependent M16 (insulinase) family peptidase|nr:insulinase family protein [Treponema sp.]
MHKGEQLSGFEILDTVELEELKAKGVWARHGESGAEVFHIVHDDEENLFAFAFATAPEDSAGAAHILEHSVLCGSENYPLKDAFLVLAQGSLQTFLNAWTFPDKTVYPASSVNERDYFNLMAVYGDAVFRPLLPEWVFMQEGHHFIPNPPSISGVVYNEMKGAYSSLDTYAGLWSIRSVLRGTPYEYESGGDPEKIPDLSWEGLREFHRRRYSPANCRIFLAGNIPTEKQLAFLHEKFLHKKFPGASAEKAAPPINAAPRWKERREYRIPCPAGTELKPTAFLSWLCSSDPGGTAEIMALSCLAEILLGHDGSPLSRILIESGLGEDLSPGTGFEAELRETVFTAGLLGLKNSSSEADLEKIIVDALEKLVMEGIPPEEIEAAMLGMEFSNREIRRSGGPWALVWLRRSLRGWLHGTKPWERLLFRPAIEEVKRRAALEPRYFEGLIKKYLLDNPHRALVILEPEADFLEKKENETAAALRVRAAGLSTGEIEALEKKNAGLEAWQEEGDSPEALARIPHLSRTDLSPEVETVDRRLCDARGVPLLSHELYTNGISYLDLAFPVDTLPPEDYPWLPLFSRVVTSLGLPGMDYGEVSSLLARTAGGFNAYLETGSALAHSGRAVSLPGGILDIRGRDWLVFRLKALDEKFADSSDLVLRLITEADFSDLRRIRDLVLEMKNDADSSLAPMGHSYASSRSGRNFSRARMVEEIWNGLSQIPFVHQLAAMDAAELAARLTRIRDALITRAGLIANLSVSPERMKEALAVTGERFGAFGPPRPRKAGGAEALLPYLSIAGAPSGGGCNEVDGTAPSGEAEVFAAPSLQIGFAAMSLSAAPCLSQYHAPELVLSHQLSTGALWERIRMKGGAYGAFAHANHSEGVFSFSTYRDPNPFRSLEAFSSILEMFDRIEAEKAGDAAHRESELEKLIIGAYSRETRPSAPSAKAFSDFLRFLYGVSDKYRSRKLEGIISVRSEDLSAAAARLASQKPCRPVIIAGNALAEKAAAALGVRAAALPV